MTIRKSIILSIAAAFAFTGVSAQNVSDLIISEVLAVPDSASLTDRFGEKSPWIELFNTSQGTVSFGGCFLTDDRDNPTKNIISPLDRSTKLGPRQSVVIYSSGRGSESAYATNFEVLPGSTVYLVSNDGKTIVDSISVPRDIPAGKTISKFANDAKALVFDQVRITSPTPGSYNAGGIHEAGGQRMAREDPHGWILTIVSVSVVFSALIILWWLFSMLFQSGKKKPAATTGNGRLPKGEDPAVAAAIAMAMESEFGNETYAAIGMALHEYMEDSVHDNESFILTIIPSDSAWKAKGQNFRRKPRP